MLYAADIQKKDTLSPVNQFNPTIQSKDFNQGLITSFDQLINGQIAGVQIMSNGGSPFSGSTIQIRGGASVNTTNEPLIVIDGVPFERGENWYDISTQINPNDIESISILKDAASAAMYGMRASKGVIVITTKKGYLGKLKIDFTSTTSLQTVTGDATMLSPDQFRKLINTEGTDVQKALLGSASTNWNNQIFKPAMAMDNHISLSGGLFNSIPFRVSIGHVGQDGILITDRTEKVMGSIVLSPSFFDHHLNITLNLRTSQNNNRFADQNAIIAAKDMNPTQPVTSDDAVFQNYFGGYWQSYITNTSGVAASLMAVRNPVATLNLTDNTSNDHVYSGRLDIDYKIHFLPEIHFKLMYGLDSYQINEKTHNEKTNPSDFPHGQTGWMNQNEKYETIHAGFQYGKKTNNKLNWMLPWHSNRNTIIHLTAVHILVWIITVQHLAKLPQRVILFLLSVRPVTPMITPILYLLDCEGMEVHVSALTILGATVLLPA
jgi:TonB-dependent SusC/RagA subfamily outer membrane receptor